MAETIKTFFDEMMDLEKQYSLLIFSSILLVISKLSKGAFENIKDKVSIAFITAFPKAHSLLSNLFNNQLIYSITEVLLLFSGASVVIFIIVISIQLICEYYLNVKISIYGKQYTFDLFLGKFAITSINLYVLIWIIVNIFNSSKTAIYVPQSAIGLICLMISSLISLSILLGLFINGKPKKEKTQNS